TAGPVDLRPFSIGSKAQPARTAANKRNPNPRTRWRVVFMALRGSGIVAGTTLYQIALKSLLCRLWPGMSHARAPAANTKVLGDCGLVLSQAAVHSRSTGTSAPLASC